MVVGIGAIEQHGHVVVLLLLVALLQLGQHGTFQQTGTDDEQGDVGLVADDGGIGDNLHGRTVNEDVVVVLTQLVEHGLELRRVQQLRGVGGCLTHGQDVEGLDVYVHVALLVFAGVRIIADVRTAVNLGIDVGMDYQLLVAVRLTAEVVGETLLGLSDEL